MKQTIILLVLGLCIILTAITFALVYGSDEGLNELTNKDVYKSALRDTLIFLND